MKRLRRWLDIVLGREAAEAERVSTDFLWDPGDDRSYEALRRSGRSAEAPVRVRPRVERTAARAPEVGGGGYALEELPAVAEPPAIPWLRRRPAVLAVSFLGGALLALVIGTASGAFDSGPTETEVDAAFESGFADGEADALDAAEESGG